MTGAGFRAIWGGVDLNGEGSNNIRVIDRAYLRRFDCVLEMNAPPRSVRGRILDEYLAGLPVSEDWKRRMAEHEALVAMRGRVPLPARVLNVGRLLADDLRMVDVGWPTVCPPVRY